MTQGRSLQNKNYILPIPISKRLQFIKSVLTVTGCYNIIEYLIDGVAAKKCLVGKVYLTVTSHGFDSMPSVIDSCVRF